MAGSDPAAELRAAVPEKRFPVHMGLSLSDTAMGRAIMQGMSEGSLDLEDIAQVRPRVPVAVLTRVCPSLPRAMVPAQVGAAMEDAREQLERQRLQPPMDIFSAGCTIAELFLESEALFDLSTLLGYRVGSYWPFRTVAKLRDPALQALVLHMTQRDPRARLSASAYLARMTEDEESGEAANTNDPSDPSDGKGGDKEKGATEGGPCKLFPAYFPCVATAHALTAAHAPVCPPDAQARLVSPCSWLYDFLRELLSPQLSTSEARVRYVAAHWQEVSRRLLGTADDAGHALAAHWLRTSISAASAVDAAPMVHGAPEAPAVLAHPSHAWAEGCRRRAFRGSGGGMDREALAHGTGASEGRTGSEAEVYGMLAHRARVLADRARELMQGGADTGQPTSALTRALRETEASERRRPSPVAAAALARAGQEDVVGGQTMDSDFAASYASAPDYGAGSPGGAASPLLPAAIGAAAAGTRGGAGAAGSVLEVEEQEEEEEEEQEGSEALDVARELRDSDAAFAAHMRGCMSRAGESRGALEDTAAELEHEAVEAPSREAVEGSTVLVNVLTSCLRSARRPRTRVLALDLICRLAPHCCDETLLQRVLPFGAELLGGERSGDPSPRVRATAVRCMAYVLSLVGELPPGDHSVVPEYVLPALAYAAQDEEHAVRLAVAECLTTVAETGMRFLNASHAYRVRAAAAAAEASSGAATGAASMGKTAQSVPAARFDEDRASLRREVWNVLTRLVGEQSAHINMLRLVILRDLLRLCLFFGRQDENAHLLFQLVLSMVNGSTERVVAAVCSQVLPLYAALGRGASHKLAHSFLVGAVAHSSERVACEALATLTDLCELQLLGKADTSAPTALASRLLCHPSPLLRRAAAVYLVAVMRWMGQADAYVHVQPALADQLRESPLWEDVAGSGTLHEGAQALCDCAHPAVSWAALDAAQSSRDATGGDDDDEDEDDEDEDDEEESGISAWEREHASAIVAAMRRGARESTGAGPGLMRAGSDRVDSHAGLSDADIEHVLAQELATVPVQAVAVPDTRTLPVMDAAAVERGDRLAVEESGSGGAGSAAVLASAAPGTTAQGLISRFGLDASVFLPERRRVGTAPGHAARKGAAAGGRNGTGALTVLQLAHRVHALGVPPLPRDLGSLRHADGTRYSHSLGAGSQGRRAEAHAGGAGQGTPTPGSQVASALATLGMVSDSEDSPVPTPVGGGEGQAGAAGDGDAMGPLTQTSSSRALTHRRGPTFNPMGRAACGRPPSTDDKEAAERIDSRSEGGGTPTDAGDRPYAAQASAVGRALAVSRPVQATEQARFPGARRPGVTPPEPTRAWLQAAEEAAQGPSTVLSSVGQSWEGRGGRSSRLSFVRALESASEGAEGGHPTMDGAIMMAAPATWGAGAGDGGGGAGAAPAPPQSTWRPRGVHISRAFAHRGAVRCVLTPDDASFVATIGAAGTMNVWATSDMAAELPLKPRFRVATTAHGQTVGAASPGGAACARTLGPPGRSSSSAGPSVTSGCLCANSRSVACAHEDGRLSVIRVDAPASGTSSLGASTPQQSEPLAGGIGGGRAGATPSQRLRQAASAAAVGPAIVWEGRTRRNEGEPLAICHGVGASQLLLLYATRRGFLRGVDLRARRECLSMAATAELGYPTALLTAASGTWAVVGTHRGYLALWDLRYEAMVALWRHPSRSIVFDVQEAPATLMHACLGAPRAQADDAGPLGACVVVAAGDNEAGVFDLASGKCEGGVRVLPTGISQRRALSLPPLEAVPVPVHPSRSVLEASPTGAPPDPGALYAAQDTAPAFNAIRGIHFGRISPDPQPWLMLTAGGDRRVRLWDLGRPEASCTVAGQRPGEPACVPASLPPKIPASCADASPTVGRCRPVYARRSALLLCQDTPLESHFEPHADSEPDANARGLSKPFTGHDDCVTSVAMAYAPALGGAFVVSGGRDGVVNVWS